MSQDSLSKKEIKVCPECLKALSEAPLEFDVRAFEAEFERLKVDRAQTEFWGVFQWAKHMVRWQHAQSALTVNALKAEVEKLKEHFDNCSAEKIVTLKEQLAAKDAENDKWKNLETKKHQECVDKQTTINQQKALLADALHYTMLQYPEEETGYAEWLDKVRAATSSGEKPKGGGE